MDWLYYSLIAFGGVILIYIVNRAIRKFLTNIIIQNATKIEPIGYLLLENSNGDKECIEVVALAKQMGNRAQYRYIARDGRIIFANNCPFIYY